MMKNEPKANREDDLKPCPCCGAKADIYAEDKNSCSIMCSRSGCRDVIAKTFDEAAKLWNAPRLFFR